jgi:UDP-N-acetylmuramyl tripeptide synthase
MGGIAARLADRIFLTDDETYDEDPDAIRQMVMEGIVEAGGEPKTEVIDDRREAIRKAMSVARKGDTILITGMGHEQFRIMNGKRESWSDVAIVGELAD